MSIREVIKPWVTAQQLIVLQPAVTTARSVRWVLATPDVTQKLCGPWDNVAHEVAYTQARAVIDAFIGGLRIATRWPPSRSAKAQLALLEERHEEVWEFRSRIPKPGVRIFGRFAEKNTFIALTAQFRGDIDDDFTLEKEKCKREWRKLFLSYDPHKGHGPGDYFSGYYLV